MKILSTEQQIRQAQREARLWQRIANQLHYAFTHPDATTDDLNGALEEYDHHTNPDTDDD